MRIVELQILEKQPHIKDKHLTENLRKKYFGHITVVPYSKVITNKRFEQVRISVIFNQNAFQKINSKLTL